MVDGVANATTSLENGTNFLSNTVFLADEKGFFYSSEDSEVAVWAVHDEEEGWPFLN